MTAIGTHSPTIKVGGTLLPAARLGQLVSLRVERALGLVGRATLRFSDEEYAVADSGEFGLGTSVEIGLPEQSAPLLVGTVTGVSLEQRDMEKPELTVVVDDSGYLLSRGTKVTTYVNIAYADVIRQIAGRTGLQPKLHSRLNTPRHDYLLQAGTDMAYIDQIARRTGCVWFIEGKNTLVMRPADAEPGSPVPLQVGRWSSDAQGRQLLEFSVKASGLRPTEAHVTGWDPASGQGIAAKSSRAGTAADSRFVNGFDGRASAGKLKAASAAVVGPSPTTNGEATQLAGALYDEWNAAAVVARGRCSVNGAIVPSATVSVENAGPASGSYLVNEVEHTYSREGFFTRFVAGPRRPSGLVDTLGAREEDPGFSAQGLVVGSVTDVADPKSEGRVKVTYVGLAGNVESDWGRIVTLGAGGNRGVTFQPEVGDEVLVGFERGDTRRPLVLGGLYSTKNTIGQTGVDRGKVVRRRLVSRLGHVVELADGEAPADQHVLLELAGGQHRLRLGKDRFDVQMPSGKPFAITIGRAAIEIDAQGNIVVQGADITLKAERALKVEGMTVDTKAQATASVQAQGNLQLKGSGQAKLDGGVVAIKGGMVQIN